MGTIYGYLKNIDGVDLSVQRKALLSLGCEYFCEENEVSGGVSRPVFLSLVKSLKAGDTLAVYELSFLFKSLPDFFNIVHFIFSKGAYILSFVDSWINFSTPEGKAFFNVVSNVSVLKNRIAFRKSELLLKSRKGGRPPKPKSDIELALKMYYSGEFTVSQICKAVNISRATLYRYLELNKY